jgi:hypothetical protein
MNDTWVDLDVGDEDLGVEEPVGEHTGVFHRAAPRGHRGADTDVLPAATSPHGADTDVLRSAHGLRRKDTGVVRRAGTAEPTMVFARPSSMYPLASADHDASVKSSELDASLPPLTLDETEFDPEAIVHRFDTVPPVNAFTRIVSKPRLVKSVVPPMIRMERTSRRAG